MTHHDKAHSSGESRTLGDLGPRVVRIAGVLGVIGLGAAAAMAFGVAKDPARFYQAYLVSYCYVLSLALGALFFVTLQHLTRSGWSVVVRRLAENVAAVLPLILLLFVPIIVGIPHLYHWSLPDAAKHDHLLEWKRPYLNVPFFVGRCLFYLAFWSLLARFFLKRSTAQDGSGDARLTMSMERISAPAMVLFGLTITFAAFDIIMSVDAAWFSTIFGVYYFSGSIVSFFSLLALTAILLQRSGRLTRSVTTEHLHDLGKLMFGFVFFWAYIAFSQYMLQWYANLPEETGWWNLRQSGPWKWALIALLFGHFVVPFLGLISRIPKRRTGTLAFWAVWILAMHWLDLYWLITPAFSAGRIPFGLIDVGCLVGLCGLCVAAAASIAGGRSLLAERDPRLSESVSFVNV